MPLAEKKREKEKKEKSKLYKAVRGGGVFLVLHPSLTSCICVTNY
jgi:hypothetical protein